MQPYIENIDDKQHIKHIGVDVLLDKLGEGNPGKKTLYLAASAYIAAQLANDPAIYKDAQLRADEQDKKKTQVMQLIKKQAKYCALSRVEFSKGIECCVHHIEGLSEQPELATDVKNLIPLTRAVHEKYHSWVIAEKLAVTRATLKQFALIHNYSRNWSTAQQLELFTAP